MFHSKDDLDQPCDVTLVVKDGAIFSPIFSENSGYVLKMSGYELSMLISSDELHVSVEEDVSNVILVWINHERNQRTIYFANYFFTLYLFAYRVTFFVVMS